MGSITAANAIYQIIIPGVFDAPQQLQGFAADDIFSTDPLTSTETSMGVDGLLSAGFVNVEVKQGITFQADSASNDVFDNWFAANFAAKDSFPASAVIIIPSIRRKWQMTTGFLTTYPPLPDGGKVLKPRKFGITWQSASRAVA